MKSKRWWTGFLSLFFSRKLEAVWLACPLFNYAWIYDSDLMIVWLVVHMLVYILVYISGRAGKDISVVVIKDVHEDMRIYTS